MASGSLEKKEKINEAVRHGKVEECAQLLFYADDCQKATVKGIMNVTLLDVMQ